MDKEINALVVFQDKNIRRTWFNDEWWFVAIDIIFSFNRIKRSCWLFKRYEKKR